MRVPKSVDGVSDDGCAVTGGDLYLPRMCRVQIERTGNVLCCTLTYVRLGKWNVLSVAILMNESEKSVA